MKNFDDPAWEKTRALLRENLPVPPLAHPDFVNSRVREEIGRPGARRPAEPLHWLVWTGAASLAAALVFSLVLLPGQFAPRSEGDFISQVIDARAGESRLSVTQFPVPDEGAVVLWIDGADFIPADQAVR
jgi:hypothetical protein